MIDINGGPCVAKRLSGCGSGCEYLAVTPWGDFYPCHQFVGNEDFLMGNVDDGIVRPDIRDMFKNSNVYSKENVRIVLQNSIAVVVVQLTHITSMVISMMRMMLDVNFRKAYRMCNNDSCGHG